MHVGPDKQANLALAERLAREAVHRGARLVALPELFFWNGPKERETEAAEPIPGPTTEALGALARELDIVLVGGSILEQDGAHAKAFNTCVTFDRSGALVVTYRKIHLFDVDLGDAGAIRESELRERGSEPVVAVTDLAPVGLAVCYDLRFPELFRRLVDDGAAVICLPSAFTFPTGAAHWEALLRARAIENLAYVIAPNQHGRGASGMLSYGNSMIVDPWGTVAARAGDGDCAIVSEIDLSYVARLRREFPCLQHRAVGR